MLVAGLFSRGTPTDESASQVNVRPLKLTYRTNSMSDAETSALA
jgi:hypothetical protein